MNSRSLDRPACAAGAAARAGRLVGRGSLVLPNTRLSRGGGLRRGRGRVEGCAPCPPGGPPPLPRAGAALPWARGEPPELRLRTALLPRSLPLGGRVRLLLRRLARDGGLEAGAGGALSLGLLGRRPRPSRRSGRARPGARRDWREPGLLARPLARGIDRLCGRADRSRVPDARPARARVAGVLLVRDLAPERGAGRGARGLAEGVPPGVRERGHGALPRLRDAPAVGRDREPAPHPAEDPAAGLRDDDVLDQPPGARAVPRLDLARRVPLGGPGASITAPGSAGSSSRCW